MDFIIWAIVVFLILAFGGVLLVGAPYVPTLEPQRLDALKLLKLKPGQTLYDLGCGDGSLLITAAQQGIKGVGYELNPLLALIAWARTRKYKGLVKIRCRSFWSAQLSDADGIYVFLLDRFMSRLDRQITSQITKPVSLATHAFKVPGKKPESRIGAIYLYRYRPLAKKA